MTHQYNTGGNLSEEEMKRLEAMRTASGGAPDYDVMLAWERWKSLRGLVGVSILCGFALFLLLLGFAAQVWGII